MRRSLIISATVLFGVVPATYLLLWVVLFVVAALAGPPDDLEIEATIVWWRVVAFFLAAAAAVVGYIALLLAARGVRTPRVIIGLALGIAANVYGIFMAWDLNSYGVRQDWYWFVSPSAVAVLHVAAYFMRDRNGIGGQPSGAA
jgi:hypothetical protein